MSNYTEKTSGAQIKALLATLFPKYKFIGNDFKISNSACEVSVGSRIELGELIDSLNNERIDPSWVVIKIDSWGHLTIVVCNYDGTDIKIED